jgi:hypothetical protein
LNVGAVNKDLIILVAQNQQTFMKKTFSLIAAFVMAVTFIACGQSEEDRKKDSMQMDSVDKETASTGDSLLMMMEAMNDSIAKADSAAAADSAKK